MYTFVTISGSMYEVDSTNNRIRRLTGEANPTPRQGRDGEWKTYRRMIPPMPVVGGPVVLQWTEETKPFVPGNLPGTMTSNVAKITQRGEAN